MPQRQETILTPQLRAEIDRAYADPRRPGSLGGISSFIRNNKDFTKAQLTAWAPTSDAYTLYRPARRRFQRNRIFVHLIDEQWQADLAEMPVNDTYKYILTVIDILSKYAWAEPLATKSARDVCAAFRRIFAESRRVPRRLQTDDGKEFLNASMKTLLQQHKVKHFTYHNEEIKGAVVERFNRTLKGRLERYMHTHNNRWIDGLMDVMYSYNHTKHTSILMTPAECVENPTENEARAHANLYRMSAAKTKKAMRTERQTPAKIANALRVGDRVRIVAHRETFRKGYKRSWTFEYFRIVKVIPREPPVYVLHDMRNRKIEGTFYAHELQRVVKTNEDVFEIERVLARRYNRAKRQHEVRVRWRGWPPEFDKWIPASSI
jgi:hypothetical protein